MMIEFCGLVVIVVSLLWLYGVKNYSYWQKCGVFNRKPFLPFLGNVRPRQFLKSIQEVTQDLYDSLEGQPYGGIYFLTTPTIMVRDLDLIKTILVKDFNYFVNRGFSYNHEQDKMSYNLIHIRGKDWKNTRQKLQPFFGPNKMKLLMPEIDKLAKEVLVQIENDNQLLDQGPISFNASDLADRYTIDVLSFWSYGIQTNTIKDPVTSELYHLAGDAFGGYHFMLHIFIGFLFPKIHALLGMTTTPKHVVKYFQNLARELIALRKSNPVRPDQKDYVDTLIKMTTDDNLNHGSDVDGQKDESAEDEKNYKVVFDEDFVAANVFIVFTAGYDASSKVCSFCLFEIAYNEDIQNKAREEVLRVLAEYDGKITLEALQKMTYLDQVVSETNRKYPLVSILFRKCVKRYRMPDGGIIEPGVPIMIPTSALYYNPIYFPNPHVFDPDRFSEENKPSIHPSTYMPFGLGPRMCLAPQFAIVIMKTLIARIISTYRLTLHESCREYPIKMKPSSFLLCSMEHIRLNIEPV